MQQPQQLGSTPSSFPQRLQFQHQSTFPSHANAPQAMRPPVPGSYSGGLMRSGSSMTPIERKRAHQASRSGLSDGKSLKKKKRMADKILPQKVRELVPESEAYMDLLAFERKLDSTIMRKKLDIQEALKKPQKHKRKLRVFISSSFYPGKTDPSDDTEDVSSWELRVEGKLVEDAAASKLSDSNKVKRKFSSFFKSLVIELDKDLYGPDNHLVEWHRTSNTQETDGFQVKRPGTQNVKCTLLLMLDYQPMQFKLDSRLARLLGVHTQTRSGIVSSLWQYVKAHKLQDPHERDQINCDQYLQQIFEAPRISFTEIPARLRTLLQQPDPIVINHTIAVEGADCKKTSCYDIDVEVDDTIKNQMNSFLMTLQSQQEIQQLDQKVQETVESIGQLKLQREFMLSFVNDPQTFISNWLVSQTRDLKTMTDVVGNPEEERRSDYYQQGWTQQAVCRYFFNKVMDSRYNDLMIIKMKTAHEMKRRATFERTGVDPGPISIPGYDLNLQYTSDLSPKPHRAKARHESPSNSVTQSQSPAKLQPQKQAPVPHPVPLSVSKQKLGVQQVDVANNNDMPAPVSRSLPASSVEILVPISPASPTQTSVISNSPSPSPTPQYTNSPSVAHVDSSLLVKDARYGDDEQDDEGELLESGQIRCTLCKKVVADREALEKHKKTHRARPFCDICKIVFSCNRLLAKHNLVHRNDFAMMCPVCNKGFNSREQMEGHMLRHSKLKAFPCTLCSTRCGSSEALQKHYRTMHSENSSYSDGSGSKPFVENLIAIPDSSRSSVNDQQTTVVSISQVIDRSDQSIIHQSGYKAFPTIVHGTVQPSIPHISLAQNKSVPVVQSTALIQVQGLVSTSVPTVISAPPSSKTPSTLPVLAPKPSPSTALDVEASAPNGH